MLSILQGNGCIFNVLLSISYFIRIEKENNSFEYLCFFINRKNFLETESSMAENRGNFERYFIPMHALGRHFQLGGLYDYRTDTILTGKYFFFLLFLCFLHNMPWGPRCYTFGMLHCPSCVLMFMPHGLCLFMQLNLKIYFRYHKLELVLLLVCFARVTEITFSF